MRTDAALSTSPPSSVARARLASAAPGSVTVPETADGRLNHTICERTSEIQQLVIAAISGLRIE